MIRRARVRSQFTSGSHQYLPSQGWPDWAVILPLAAFHVPGITAVPVLEDLSSAPHSLSPTRTTCHRLRSRPHLRTAAPQAFPAPGALPAGPRVLGGVPGRRRAGQRLCHALQQAAHRRGRDPVQDGPVKPGAESAQRWPEEPASISRAVSSPAGEMLMLASSTGNRLPAAPAAFQRSPTVMTSPRYTGSIPCRGRVHGVRTSVSWWCCPGGG